jgi:hypothetical protein
MMDRKKLSRILFWVSVVICILKIALPAQALNPLEISNGATTGGGTFHVPSSANHSSERLKSNIRPISEEDEK